MPADAAVVMHSASAGSAFDIEIITTLEEVRALLPQWREFLAQGAGGASFFNDPAHIELRCVTDREISPSIVVLRREDRIRCIAPCYATTMRFRLQLSVLTLASMPARMLKIFGDQFIVAAGEDAEKCINAVFDALLQQPECNLLALENLDATSPLWNFCQPHFRGGGGFRMFLALPQMETVRQIHFPRTHDEFMMGLSPKARQNLRRRTRNLVREQNVRLESVTVAEQVPRFLDQVDTVFRDSWQAKTFGQASRNSEQEARYYAGLAQLGWLRSYVLMGDAVPVAYEIGFQYQGVFHCYEVAYRQAWSALGPGSVLTNLIIEDLYQRDLPKVYDFGLGDLEHKRSLCNAEHPAAAIYLARAGKWRLALMTQATLHAIERGARKTLGVLRLDEPIRRLLKRRK